MILRRPATASDAVPASIRTTIGSMPGADLAGARAVQVAPNAAPFWIVPSSETAQVALAGESRIAGFGPDSLDRGHLMRVDESLSGDPSGIVVTGLLPDGSRDIRFVTDAGDRVVNLVDGTYSLRFARTSEALPKLLRWTDDAGEHESLVPLSPDTQP